jgi:hypothetical protein
VCVLKELVAIQRKFLWEMVWREGRFVGFDEI